MTPCAFAEAVHLHQQLVQRLLALVVAAAESGAALAADGVDLVDEDDARAVLLGLLEQVAHPGGADADEHLDEVGPGDGEERHARLAGDGARQQRLTGSRRAVEQHALGDLGAQRLIPRRVLQEVLDLVELLDRLVGAGDVGEGGLGHVLVQQLGPGLAEAEAHPGAALHAGEHHEQADQQQQRQHVDHQRAEDAALVDDGADLRVFAVQRVEQRNGVAGRELGDDLVGAFGAGRGAFQRQPHLLLAVVDLGVLDVAGLDLGHRHRGVDRLESAGVVAEVEEGPTKQQHDGDGRERADHVFPVHQSSAVVGQVLPINAAGIVQATARDRSTDSGAGGSRGLVEAEISATQDNEPRFPRSARTAAGRPFGRTRRVLW